MRILITGGAGFIATNFIKYLIDNKITSNPSEDIIALDNLSHGSWNFGIHDKIHKVTGDIRDDATEQFYENIDVVFHFAGIVSIYDADADREEAIDVNVRGSLKVLEFAKKHNVGKVVYAETSAMYEDVILPKNGYNEDTVAPRTIYATTKLMLRNLALGYMRLGELNVTGLRFFNVVGEHQDFKRTIPPAACGFGIRILQNNKPIIFGDPNRRRDFIDVNDIVSFLAIMLDKSKWDETNGEAYNLGTGTSISLLELVDQFYKLTGKENIGYIQEDEINGEAFEIFADISKAKKLGWKPEYSTYETNRYLVHDFKTKISLGIIPGDYMEYINFSNVKIGK